MLEKIDIVLVAYYIINALIQLATIIFCIYYYIKKRSIDGLLMMIGSIFSFIVAVGGVLLISYFSYYGAESIIKGQRISSVATMISSLIFLIGFIMLLVKVSAKKLQQ